MDTGFSSNPDDFRHASIQCLHGAPGLIPFYVAMLCLKTKSASHTFASIEALYHLLQISPVLLQEKVNFSYPAFFDIVAAADVFQYQARQEAMEYKAKKEVLQQEMNLLLNSLSWKVTKPLRWLKSLFVRS